MHTHTHTHTHTNTHSLSLFSILSFFLTLFHTHTLSFSVSLFPPPPTQLPSTHWKRLSFFNSNTLGRCAGSADRQAPTFSSNVLLNSPVKPNSTSTLSTQAKTHIPTTASWQHLCSIPFSSVRDGIYMLRKAHICSTPSLKRLPSVAFPVKPNSTSTSSTQAKTHTLTTTSCQHPSSIPFSSVQDGSYMLRKAHICWKSLYLLHTISPKCPQCCF